MSGKHTAGSGGWVEGSALGGTAWKLRVSKDESQKTKHALRLETKHGAKSSGGTNIKGEVGDAMSPSSDVLSCAFACFVAELAAARGQGPSRPARRGDQLERRRRPREEDAGKLEVTAAAKYICRR